MHYQEILQQIPSHIQLVAVSKGHPIESILSVYQTGCRDFGENRIQEALEKQTKMPSDIRWHMIGTLQLNKVRKAIGKFTLIHSVDTPELAQKISSCSLEQNLKTAILLQVNTSGELSKHGLSVEQWRKAFASVLALPGVHIEGLMTIAPLVEDKETIRRCFASLREFRDELEKQYKISLPKLSMGMSHDYQIAIQEGATLLRIGSAIFKP
ncbi:MAG: YggS family pyridoxal phosphate-dependent enzyme [Parachlamydiaceae bacterium]|nr:YggS family pyridoxal phosphate-dependent enzyme [Parachlamydiaceae bacterium]